MNAKQVVHLKLVIILEIMYIIRKSIKNLIIILLHFDMFSDIMIIF